MKFLTLVRHSSAVHDPAYRDFDRPLRPGGIDKMHRNAAVMNEAGLKPDLLISSPAARALESAVIYAEDSAAGLNPDGIVCFDSLYMPSPGDILDCVRSVDDGYSDVFLFSHNNGISWAAQQFCGDGSILMPTGSAVRISFDTESWLDIVFGGGIKTGFYP